MEQSSSEPDDPAKIIADMEASLKGDDTENKDDKEPAPPEMIDELVTLVKDLLSDKPLIDNHREGDFDVHQSSDAGTIVALNLKMDAYDHDAVEVSTFEPEIDPSTGELTEGIITRMFHSLDTSGAKPPYEFVEDVQGPTGTAFEGVDIYDVNKLIGYLNNAYPPG